MRPVLTTMLLSALLLLPLQSCSRQDRALEEKLKELNCELDRRDYYYGKHRRMADSLHAILAHSPEKERWNSLRDLYRHFDIFDVDSSEHYLDLMIAAEDGKVHRAIKDSICRADLLRKKMNCEDALLLLDNMDTAQFSQYELSQWYLTRLRVYSFISNDQFSSETQKLLASKCAGKARREFIASGCISPFEKSRQSAILAGDSGDPRRGIEILLPLYENANTEGQKQTAAYYIGEFYERAGDSHKAQYWLAQSSIHSLRKMSNSTNSLFMLSKLLYEDGHIELARQFNDCSMLTSIQYKHPYWINNIFDLHTTLYNLVDSRRRTTMYVWSVFSITILTFLVILLIYHIRLARQKRKVNEVNESLGVANKIRDNYIYRYILLSAQYLQRQDEHDSELRKILKNEGVDALVRKVRNSFYDSKKYDEFYAVFDKSFLACFPDFVAEVNAFLPPEAAFEVAPGEPFPTELRILALARLGLRESGQIAQFLKCAPSSIYAYKSRLKKAAIDAEAFEKEFFG